MSNKALNKESLLALITSNGHKRRLHGVKTLGLFGSFSNNKQTEQSDVDLLVDFEPEKETYRNFINFAYFMEELIGRKVEIVTSDGLSPYIGTKILKEVEYVPL